MTFGLARDSRTGSPFRLRQRDRGGAARSAVFELKELWAKRPEFGKIHLGWSRSQFLKEPPEESCQISGPAGRPHQDGGS